MLLLVGAKVDVENQLHYPNFEAIRCYDYELEIIELLVCAEANVTVSVPYLGESVLVWAI